MKLDPDGRATIHLDSQEEIDMCQECKYSECINCLEKIGTPKRKGVDQLTIDGEFIRWWATAAEAARALGINPQNITNCLKGRCKRAGQYRWRYASAN